MQTARIVAAIAAAAAAASACSNGDGCPYTDTVRSEEREADPTSVCAGASRGALPNLVQEYLVSCDLCGSGYNSCAMDGTYGAALAAARSDGGTSACPTPEGKTTVTIFCSETVRHPGTRTQGCVIEGRRPEGLAAARIDARSALGRYFAEHAHLEAAAVLAFDQMIAELIEHGAPEDLVIAAMDARSDEIRHAETTTAFARRFGASTPPAIASPARGRSLYEIALENEIEGVVRETFGAAVAVFRAEHAADPEIRAAMRAIARDEALHAVLSHAVGRWLHEKLDDGARTQIDAAQMQAIADLRRAATEDPPPVIRRVAGEPTAREMKAMLDALERSTWNVSEAA